MRRAIGTVAALTLLVAGPAAWATIVRGFSLEAMTLESHAVVRGEVIDEEVVYDADRGRVYTHSFVRIRQAWSGHDRPGDVIAVRQIGGLLDGVESHVVGTVDLHVGDDVVLFARTDGAFHYLVGMSQGLWQIDHSPAGAPVVARGVDSLRLARPAGPTHGAAPDRTTLAELRARVEAILAGGGTR
ncbi:MAG: hypothetical protein ACQEXJ_03465 [Myxococcota bacterium]